MVLQFIEDVDAYMAGKDMDSAVKMLQDRYQQYKLAEVRFRRHSGDIPYAPTCGLASHGPRLAVTSAGPQCAYSRIVGFHTDWTARHDGCAR